MANKKSTAPTKIEREFDQVVAGIASAIPVGSTVMVDGVAYTQPDLLAKAELFRGVFKNLRVTRATEAQQQAEADSARPDAQRFLQELRAAVTGFLGSTSPKLGEFGYAQPKKRADLTAEQKALRAERARRTRQARHTMGSRQKAAIHGEPVQGPMPDAPQPPAAPSDPTKKAP
jgi:hypothetical protein